MSSAWEHLPLKDRQSFSAALLRGESQLHLDRLVRALFSGVQRGLEVTAGAAMAALLWALYTWSIAWSEARWSAEGLALFLGTTFALAVLSRLLPALFNGPTEDEVAYALDEASDTRDRLQIALNYARLERPLTSFERAALDDGLRAVHLLKPGRPLELVLVSPGAKARALVPLALLVALAISALLVPARGLGRSLSARSQDGIETPAMTTAEALPLAPGRAGGEERPRTIAPAEAPKNQKAEPKPTRPGESSAQVAAAETPPERDPARGTPGQGQPIDAETAAPSAASSGDPTAAKDAPKDPKAPAQKRAPAPPKEATTRPIPPRKDERPSGSTVGASGSGGGAMSPVPSPWTAKDASRDAPLPEVPTEDEIQDEIDPDEARSGTQPALKDRRGATSRDLTISGPGDEPGDGRGGPSQPKKARGTAALILGVPLPDFVRGQLNPGTTKVTQKRVEPVPNEGPLTEPRRLSAREGSEVPLEWRAIPPAARARLRQILHLRDRIDP